MQYVISRNNFENTLRTSSGQFCRKLPMYKNKINLNWKRRILLCGFLLYGKPIISRKAEVYGHSRSVLSYIPLLSNPPKAGAFAFLHCYCKNKMYNLYIEDLQCKIYSYVKSFLSCYQAPQNPLSLPFYLPPHPHRFPRRKTKLYSSQ